jgi:hypothetical protein
MNPYSNNPYIQQSQGLDQQGLAPVFQNISAQQAAENSALNQQNQLVAQAGQTQGSGLSGLNPLAMAAMLRKKQPETMGGGETPNWNNPYTTTGGYFDQGAYGNSYGVGTGGFE